MTQQRLLCIAAISGFMTVVLGAFGAHALKNGIASGLYAAYQTGVEYHFYHTLTLLFLALYNVTGTEKVRLYAVVAFIVGILLFSGSLYLMALTGNRSLGMITPIGGISFLIGWGLLGYTAIVANRR